MTPSNDNEQNCRKSGNVTPSEPNYFSDLLGVPRNTASAIELHMAALWDDSETISEFVSRTHENINFGLKSSMIFAGYLMGRFVARNEMLSDIDRAQNAAFEALKSLVTWCVAEEE